MIVLTEGWWGRFIHRGGRRRLLPS